MEGARSRFTAETVTWLITVRGDGQPQASPVWVIWDDRGLLLYSQPATQKLKNIAANPKVCLHLDGGVEDGTTWILEGDAHISDGDAAGLHPDFRDKYAGSMERMGWTPEAFLADYSVPVRVAPLRLRSW